MKESQKTIAFVVAALLMGAVAWASLPSRIVPQTGGGVGQRLFPDFNDPLAAKRLDITRFDEKAGELDRFEVAEQKGVWSIPSKQNYPADAKTQMADAAGSLYGLEILSVASERPSDHEMYGVIDPQPTLKMGATGVGTRVTMRDGTEKELASLIIGKEVKDQPGQRYVRHGGKGRDQVYVVKFDASKLSTKFGEWIEKDLLGLNPMDLADVDMHDYTVQLAVQPDGQPVLNKGERSKIDLGYDSTAGQWSLDKLETYQGGAWIADGLKPEEELNAAKLDELKTALQDLKIVDVERKPPGVSQDLRADAELNKNVEVFQSLVQKGFFPLPPQPGQERGEVLSSEGDIVVGAKNGVEYVLRFGEIAGQTKAEDLAKTADGNAAAAAGVNRYLLVAARFNEDLIPKPTLEPVAGATAPAAEQPAADAPAQPSGGAGAVQEAEAEAAAEATKTAEPAAPATETPKGPEGGGGADPSPAQTEAPADQAAPAEAKAEAPSADEKAAAETPEATPAAEPAKKDEAAISVPGNLSEADQAARAQQIEQQKVKENERRQKEYDDKVKAGQQRVKELNDRFAEWYYVISDAEYRKIHLNRADIVKPKGEAAGATNPAEFDNLKGLLEGMQQPQ
jgi:hypothetical protein